MTRSGLASAPRAASPRASEPVPAGAPPVRPPDRSHRGRYERILAWSLLVSLLLHLLFLLFVPSTHPVPPGSGSAVQAPAQQRAPAGMEMIIAIPSENAPDLPVPEETPPTPIQRTAPATRAAPPLPQPGGTSSPAAPVPSADVMPSGGSVREALQPGYRDPRLYAPSREFPELEKTEHERYLEHLQARIDAVNDSMGVASARNRRTSDWTVTDGAGKKWGLSPEGLHLGGLTVPRALLPLPGPTGDNQSLEAERERQRMREEIQRQEEATERARTQRERIEQMRESR